MPPVVRQLVARSPQHAGPVRGLAFSFDGERLVSAGGDGVVSCWSIADQREIWRIRTESSGAPAVACNPRDDSLLVVESLGRALRVRPTGTFDEVVRLRGRVWDVANETTADRVLAMEAEPPPSPDETAGARLVLRGWDELREDRAWPLPAGTVSASVAVSRRGTRVACLTTEGALYVFSREGTASPTWSAALREPSRVLCAWGEEQFFVVSGESAQFVRVAAERRGVETDPIPELDDVIDACADVSGGIVAVSAGGRLMLVRPDAANRPSTLARLDVTPTAVAASKDGSRIAVGTDRGGVRLFDRAGKEIWGGAHRVAIGDIAASADGATVITSDHHSKAVVWRTSDWSMLYGIDDLGEPIAISSDGGLVAGFTRAGVLRVHRLSDPGTVVHSTRVAVEHPLAIDFSWDGSYLAVGGCGADPDDPQDRRVSLAVVDVGRRIVRSPKPGEVPSVYSIARSPRGSTLLLGGMDAIRELDPVTLGTTQRCDTRGLYRSDWVRLPQWAPDGRRLSFAFPTNPDPPRWPTGHVAVLPSLADVDRALTFATTLERVTALAWTEAGRSIAIAGGERNRGRVEIRDADDGSLRRSWQGHDEIILGAVAVRDGRELVTVSADGTAIVWDVGTPRPEPGPATPGTRAK